LKNAGFRPLDRLGFLDPAHPSVPPRRVNWGEGATDEFAFVQATVDAEQFGYRPP